MSIFVREQNKGAGRPVCPGVLHVSVACELTGLLIHGASYELPACGAACSLTGKRDFTRRHTTRVNFHRSETNSAGLHSKIRQFNVSAVLYHTCNFLKQK